MKAMANYILIAKVKGEEYYFEYDTPDVWTALEKFWREDYMDTLHDKSCYFPIDVLAMIDGHVQKTYQLSFVHALFRAFYDKGHKVDGPYTLDEFDKELREEREDMNVMKGL